MTNADGGNMSNYLKEYKWKDIFQMIRNLKKDPSICENTSKGKTVVITGATSGIGLETVKKYASMGAKIITVNRNEEKSIKLCQEISRTYNVDCSYYIADFSRLSDIHEVGQKLALLEFDIDILIHNAGTYVTDKMYTEDNLELVFQTNYLSTFILNYHLKDKLIIQNKCRIIFVNSEAHRFAVWGLHMDDLNWRRHKYRGIKGYGFAKMAQLLSMINLKEIFEGSKVTVNAMHPGNVVTNSGSSNGKTYKFFKRKIIDKSARPIEIASEALYYLGVSDEVKDISGKFFNLTTLEVPAPPALDKEAAEKLWNLSIELGGLE